MLNDRYDDRYKAKQYSDTRSYESVITEQGDLGFGVNPINEQTEEDKKDDVKK